MSFFMDKELKTIGLELKGKNYYNQKSQFEAWKEVKIKNKS